MNLSMWRGCRVPLLAFALVFILAACGDTKPGDVPEGDTTAVTDSAATHAEMDRAIADYNEAADSLALVLGELRTVEDVERLAPTIRHLESRIDAFNEASARYGNALLDRMGSNPTQPAFERLRTERERIDSLPEVAQKLAEVEARQGAEIR